MRAGCLAGEVSSEGFCRVDGDETKGKLPEAEAAVPAAPDRQPVDALVHDAVRRILLSITPVAVSKPADDAASCPSAADVAGEVTEGRPEAEAVSVEAAPEPVVVEPVAGPGGIEPAIVEAVDDAPDVAIASQPAGDSGVDDLAREEANIAAVELGDDTAEIERQVEPVESEHSAISRPDEAAKEAERPGVSDDVAEKENRAAAPLIADQAIVPPRTGRSLRDRLRGPWTIGRVARLAGLAVAAYFGTVMVLIVLYRFINPPTTTLIAYQWLTGTKIEQTWVPIEDISGNLLRAVVVSEDWGFCDHYGVDLVAIEKALEQAGEGKIARGASTISMQVIKNLFLSQSKSYLRKAVEIPLTIVAEAVWPKSRMLEIYLNIAEWGPGVFGAEAAAQHHFSKPASQLTGREAALLAAALPNPILRDAGDPGTRTARKASVIQARMRAAGPVADCAMTGRQRSSEAGRDEDRSPGDGWRTTVKKRAGAGEGL